MTGRIGVHPVSFVGVRIRCILKDSSAEVDGATMRRCGIGHMEVDVDLLRLSVRPIWRNVLRCMLYADQPIPLLVDDAVEPRVLVDHAPVEHCSPEGALSCDICSVEYHDMANEVHGGILRVPRERRHARRFTLHWDRIGAPGGGHDTAIGSEHAKFPRDSGGSNTNPHGPPLKSL